MGTLATLLLAWPLFRGGEAVSDRSVLSSWIQMDQKLSAGQLSSDM